MNGETWTIIGIFVVLSVVVLCIYFFTISVYFGHTIYPKFEKKLNIVSTKYYGNMITSTNRKEPEKNADYYKHIDLLNNPEGHLVNYADSPEKINMKSEIDNINDAVDKLCEETHSLYITGYVVFGILIVIQIILLYFSIKTAFNEGVIGIVIAIVIEFIFILTHAELLFRPAYTKFETKGKEVLINKLNDYYDKDGNIIQQ